MIQNFNQIGHFNVENVYIASTRTFLDSFCHILEISNMIQNFNQIGHYNVENAYLASTRAFWDSFCRILEISNLIQNFNQIGHLNVKNLCLASIEPFGQSLLYFESFKFDTEFQPNRAFQCREGISSIYLGLLGQFHNICSVSTLFGTSINHGNKFQTRAKNIWDKQQILASN